MLQQQTQFIQQEKQQLVLSYARTESEVREAQRLRYKIFAEEMQARLPGTDSRLDVDKYDAHCEHLLVRDAGTNEVVGTYRILTPSQAKKMGGYYAETEFDLDRLVNLQSNMVEVGRSCVHADYRSGGVIALLWSGLAHYMQKNRFDYLVGCASISMIDGGHNAASIYNKLKVASMCPAEWRVFPRCALPLASLDGDAEVYLPPLIKGYLRLGAYVCGDPAWDPDFNTADLLMLLPMSKMNPRYARHFLGK
ncbi:GNAT family N-acetyltransferase [Sulfurirhabdus autotrophica]|uniref:L-ornithine N(alpha)-acyltransferase n=2 Tax=Sulfurirhabdus autotrophica TaxID=1706046 RepID=A0A4R3Y023_9PROT|nr:GNAT family N-acyltransferase [Sulfurirhabdus autotrophica]TCV83323.1 putative hemolysin [Sulfurirhabdus autotrophica]